MKRLLHLSLLLLLVVLSTTGSVFAQQVDPTTVTTSAQITPGANPPSILNAFMLPDNDALPGFQLLPAPYQPAPNGLPVNVQPNLQNNPPQTMGFWVAVSDLNGYLDIRDVYIRVFHPDGTFKYQFHLTRVAPVDVGNCSAIGPSTTAGTPLYAAVATGQKTAAEAATLYHQCTQMQVAFYFGTAEITKDQPWGIYDYVVTALDNGSGTSAPATFQFEVLQIAGLALDFQTVDFGQIVPTTPDITDGDTNFCPPGSNLPTVMSIGNVWLNLNVQYAPMANVDKVIDVFDIRLGVVDQNPNTQEPVIVNPVYADAPALVANYLLLPNCPTKVQFSIHPELLGPIRGPNGQVGLPAGAYTGSVQLWGTMSTGQWTLGWQDLLNACPSETCAPV